MKKGKDECMNKEKSNKRNKVKYYECFVYGHIWVEYLKFKKNKEKFLYVTCCNSSEFETSYSSLYEQSSFLTFTTIVEEFS